MKKCLVSLGGGVVGRRGCEGAPHYGSPTANDGGWTAGEPGSLVKMESNLSVHLSDDRIIVS